MAEPMPFEELEREVHRPELVEPITPDVESWSDQGKWQVRGEQFGRNLGKRLTQLRRTVRDAIQKARELGNRYPLQTIGVIAGAAFLLGIALRVGRKKRG